VPIGRRRRSGGSGPPKMGVLMTIGVVAVLAVIGWFWFRAQGPGEIPDEAPSPVAAPDTSPAVPDVPPLDLPELSASDAFVRDQVARLSSHPRLAAWLVTDRLIERFVLLVVELAGGSNPSEHVRHMQPQEGFTVREVDGRLVIAPESFRRYDLLAATFASLDTPGTVQLYRQLRPLIDEAFQELGIPDRTFDETLELAIRNVLAAEVPTASPEVVPVEGVYEFRDPALEARRGGEKLLIRMGPQNARRIQEKLRELSEAPGWPRSGP
jgi:hypothetical protein